MFLFAALPATLPDPSTWIRVDDPEYPGAIFGSSSGAVLAEPPTDGTPWRPETIPVIDRIPAEDIEDADAIDADFGDVVKLTNADLWHAAGVRGKGVKVAVFDSGWFGGETDRDKVAPYTTHDCFLARNCEVPFDELLPSTSSGGGTHGWACAETVRQLAPEAELHLVRVDSQTMYENAVDWAIREGVNIISLSMSFYNDSLYDGTGPHDALTTALDGAGALIVGSAGNDGLLRWGGRWVDADADDRFDGDGDNGLWWYIDRPTSVVLSWNQWGIRCGDTDLDVAVYDDRGYDFGHSNDPQERDTDRACEPVDSVTPTVQEPGWYRVVVHRLRGSTVGLELSLIARSGQWLEPVPEGSIPDPKAHPLAVAVGAVRASNYWNGPPEGFSSRGPTRVGLQKPEIAGPDGLTVSPYGPVGFFGTSASAPAVAGLVALVMSDDTGFTSDARLTSRQAFERLQGWAHLPSPTRNLPDPATAYGTGLARLPVREPIRPRCGERPLIAGLFLPLWLLGRKRR